jgi:hypothetical protein
MQHLCGRSRTLSAWWQESGEFHTRSLGLIYKLSGFQETRACSLDAPVVPAEYRTMEKMCSCCGMEYTISIT